MSGMRHQNLTQHFPVNILIRDFRLQNIPMISIIDKNQVPNKKDINKKRIFFPIY